MPPIIIVTAPTNIGNNKNWNESWARITTTVLPPAGGNAIVVIMAQESFQFLIFPIMVGAVTIILGGIIYNRLILNKKYPLKWL